MMLRAGWICTPLLVLGLAVCAPDAGNAPETALAAWVAAMNASRADVSARRRAYDLLASESQRGLQVRAARASQLSGREMHPWEMLAPGRFAMRFAFDPEALNASIHGDRAVVIARGRAGESASVPMVLESGHWRVDLVLPAMRVIQAGGDRDAGP